jgi:hypothetical protein
VSSIRKTKVVLMKFSEKLSRRQMVAAVSGIGAASLLSFSANAKKKKKGKGGSDAAPLVKPGEGMAAAVNYQTDHSKVAKDKQMAKQGCEFTNQKCSNCVLFTPGPQVDGKDAGKCSLFAQNSVEAGAWCVSWNLKPGSKC